ncbi:MAG: dTDP-4-dehydrorhamnose reductase [Roseinatronobacter sp.]
MILVFGKTGQVARELARLAPEVRFLGRTEADLSDPAICAAAIQTLRPRAVINAAAYTAVDRAETDEESATVVNGLAPEAMAQACAVLNVPMVQISTDYVFDGSGTQPFAPDHPTGPLGAYGRSKLRGEIGVRGAGAAHVILRTSWVFSAHGTNFVKTMLRFGAERDLVRVVADQVGGPTPARAIAVTCLRCAHALCDDPSLSGTYHLAGQPLVSWAEFARAIMQAAGLSCVVQDIPSSDYPTPARRPLNSRLDCSTLVASFGITLPDWQEELAAILAELEQAQDAT